MRNFQSISARQLLVGRPCLVSSNGFVVIREVTCRLYTLIQHRHFWIALQSVLHFEYDRRWTALQVVLHSTYDGCQNDARQTSPGTVPVVKVLNDLCQVQADVKQ